MAKSIRPGPLQAKTAAVSVPAGKVRSIRKERMAANSKLKRNAPVATDEVTSKIIATLGGEKVELEVSPEVKAALEADGEDTPPPVTRFNGKPVMKLVDSSGPVTIEQAKEPETVILAEPQTLRLDLKFLHAAITVAPTKDQRSYLNGVHIHQLPDGQTRVVATDGHRLLVTMVPNELSLEWAQGNGVTLPTSDLTRIARYFGKQGEVEISFGVNHATATISQPGDMAKFSLALVTDERWPDYQRIMDDGAKAFHSERTSMETANIDTDYLKSAGHIANQLEAKGVMPFVGSDSKSPVVFTFADVPEVLLYIMPLGTPDECVSETATRMIGKSSMKDTVLQLREQAKHKTYRAKVAKHKFFRDQFTAAALKLNQRADALEARLMLQITGPKAVKA